MRGVVFETRAEAEAAQRALDVAAGVPRAHAEGSGPGDWSIATPGAAAARIRARGVRTEHVAEVISRPDGTAHALMVASDGRGEEIAADGWFPEARGAVR